MTELSPVEEGPVREQCYGCFRPVNYCHCDRIPSIKNRTEVLILQDRREHFHPFNTARMVRAALGRCQLIVDRRNKLAEMDIPFKKNSGLLFPSSDAVPLESLSPVDRPGQLVVIDGTWHQAKQILRDVPAIRALPKYGLRPTQPGQFRIRREPNETALATVEAVVAALRVLEPETSGFDDLLKVFHSMVQVQIDHPKADLGWRENRRRSQTPFNIPLSVIFDLDNIVVAYGESLGGERNSELGKDAVPRKPIFWVAERLGTGERMTVAIRYDGISIDDEQLVNLELRRESFEGALSPNEFREAWQTFLKPDDVLTFYNHSTGQLLKEIDACFVEPLILKSVDLQRGKPNGAIHDWRSEIDMSNLKINHPGRAGQRLAMAIELVKYLHRLGRNEKEEPQKAPRNTLGPNG